MTLMVVSTSTPARASELAVGLAVVPARWLVDELVDDVVGQRLADPPLRDAGERPPRDHADDPQHPDGDDRRAAGDDGAGADRDPVLGVEARDDDVVDDPLHGDARRDRAEREHECAGDSDGEVLRVEPNQGAHERDVAAQARQSGFFIRFRHGTFLPARRPRSAVTSDSSRGRLAIACAAMARRRRYCPVDGAATTRLREAIAASRHRRVP